jgi:hypothetical protein
LFKSFWPQPEAPSTMALTVAILAEVDKQPPTYAARA